MTNRVTNVAILGSTGSIGQSAMDVIAASNGCLRAVAISANQSLAQAVQQARAVQPRWLVATDAEQAARFDWSELPAETELLVGGEGLETVVASDEVDVVLSAIVGSAGFETVFAGYA